MTPRLSAFTDLLAQEVFQPTPVVVEAPVSIPVLIIAVIALVTAIAALAVALSARMRATATPRSAAAQQYGSVQASQSPPPAPPAGWHSQP
ncbi:hypothetical protein R3Q08_24550 [Rhodococcus erythropolis]|uniref:hypothetical protein n=1 Tax=Rhodococcus TaxID=1827 RepID=UPI0011125888|nr:MULTISPECIES: hypothetical protein [Rhodococcus]MCS4251807.1 hypothetical protein [Rhodococcus erythropolis]MCW2426963.1 hypothetical protein [Rhodococcus erythropolis]MDV6211435.1 hypothetical protein [Rhodococcus erythropolis]MDV8010334.1 hypothetical protein [Rhodococcus sp. IEGM 1241]